MKKKFDFSAEMSEAESIRSTPKNEYLEEENHLLDINVQELARLNNNVYGKSSVSCPLKPSDSAPLKHSTMPP